MTDQYAVIGNPISHSKSPPIHRMFAEQTGQDISYEAIESPLDGFAATIERLRAAGYEGCNVTVPFKFEAFELATRLSERAQSAQAVNTLKFEGGAILGDNTDGAGLVADIEHNLGVSLRDKRVLLMGAGGAAYGVILPLVHAGAHIAVANRTADKARQLAAAFAASGEVTGCGYDELDELQFDVIVNATSAGLSDSAIPLPDSIFAPNALAYDMMYGRETPFMAFAREHGAHVADGLGMLVEQAAEAFHIWRGVRPDTRPVLEKLRSA
ncbi:MAG: shikimate dehydrogenase [Gallionella sp.]|jgi:shikimate dehydrogenase|nr:shikimate dehydrogenase [Gallionella sp.]